MLCRGAHQSFFRQLLNALKVCAPSINAYHNWTPCVLAAYLGFANRHRGAPVDARLFTARHTHRRRHPLPRHGTKPQRVCDVCYDQLERGKERFLTCPYRKRDDEAEMRKHVDSDWTRKLPRW